MRRIIGWLLPKEGRFFDMLVSQSNNVLESANKFNELVNNLALVDLKKTEEFAREIKEIEKKGDRLSYETIQDLNKSFITPLDREDIHKLILLLDDFLDMTKDISQRIVLYKINFVSKEFIELKDLAVELAKEVNQTMVDLKKLNNIEEHCIRINELEERADDVFHKSMAIIFNNGQENALNIFKMMDVYQSLEQLTDKCKEISTIVGNIGVKHA